MRRSSTVRGQMRCTLAAASQQVYGHAYGQSDRSADRRRTLLILSRTLYYMPTRYDAYGVRLLATALRTARAIIFDARR